jgi:quercetin dioxygenase-like cupin family protein
MVASPRSSAIHDHVFGTSRKRPSCIAADPPGTTLIKIRAGEVVTELELTAEQSTWILIGGRHSMNIWKNSTAAWDEFQPGVFRRILSHTQFATLALYRFTPQAKLPLHKAGSPHFGLFVHGNGHFDTDKGTFKVSAGDAFFIQPGEGHGFANTSLSEAIVLEVFVPPTDQHLADAQAPQITF